MTSHFKFIFVLLLTVTFVLLSIQSSLGQSISKGNELKKLFQPTPKHNHHRFLKNSHNEFDASAALLFLAYKSFFSSQDMTSCVFTPSCSEYAIESFQNDNPLLAYVKIFDRLSRCHPFSSKNEYSYFKNTALLYDPVH